jgi:hypothetical protein
VRGSPTHGQIVRREEVHVHELALQAGFVLDDIAHFGCDAPAAEQAIRRFESFLPVCDRGRCSTA